MRLRYTDTALSEIEESLSYIARDNPAAAAKIAEAIERTIYWITKRPLMSPVVHAGDVRSKLVLAYQYRVFYSVEGDEIIIRNVRSTRRRRPWEGQT